MNKLPTLCSEASEYVREPLAGTAAFASTWVLVEERGPWAAKPLESPGLKSIRHVLDRWVTEIPNVRIQLIRHPDRDDSAPRRIFVAEPASGGFRRIDADDIAKVDLRSGVKVSETTFFVCTHGKRDRCCAVRGSKLFRAMYDLNPHRVWQTSHLGGHRFAATAVSFPAGYCVGRVEPEEAQALLDSQGVHDLKRLRGRVCYRPAVQAAEAALRQLEEVSAVDAVRVVRVGHDETTWTVHFRLGEDSDSSWKVTVRPEITGTLRHKSCGADVDAVQVFPSIVERA